MIDHLRNLLCNVGVCPDCNQDYVHCENEPFASCNCGTTEWTGTLPRLHVLKKRIAFLEADIRAGHQACDELQRRLRGARNDAEYRTEHPDTNSLE